MVIEMKYVEPASITERSPPHFALLLNEKYGIPPKYHTTQWK